MIAYTQSSKLQRNSKIAKYQGTVSLTHLFPLAYYSKKKKKKTHTSSNTYSFLTTCPYHYLLFASKFPSDTISSLLASCCFVHDSVAWDPDKTGAYDRLSLLPSQVTRLAIQLLTCDSANCTQRTYSLSEEFPRRTLVDMSFGNTQAVRSNYDRDFS